ncbi:MAG: YidC/Oxa1 family insertase periplasmic-domain containing protein [Cephaloticoccus sp.]
MDKKNLTIGVALLLAAIASMYFNSPKPVPPSPDAAPAATAAGDPAAANPTAIAPAAATTPVATTAPSELKALPADRSGDEVSLLANGMVEVRLSNFGGAIKEVALRQFSETLGSTQRYVFNEVRTGPMLGLVDYPGLDQYAGYEIVVKSAKEVVYRAILDNRIEVTRRYFLPDGSEEGTDPYQLRHDTTLRNLTNETLPLPQLAVSLGTVKATSDDVYGQQLTSGYSNGKDQEFIEHSALQGGDFLAFFGIGSNAPTPVLTTPTAVNWASLSNQFFTSVLTPDQPGTGLVTRRVPLPLDPAQPGPQKFGLGAETRFDVAPLAPQGSVTLGMDFYVGPKEYRRLSDSNVFDQDQDSVLNFAPYFFNKIFFSEFFAPLLLTIMTWVHGWMEPLSPQWAWGWAIVITTLILKFVFLPLTLSASRSGKRMQKLQPEMQALREKYKDNPQKMQQATMELFKKHKVNPLGGCLPIFVTMPFFIAFFAMLHSAAELRFEAFLWAPDLTTTDTVARIFGLPLNILPLLMGATMIIQMRLTPTPTTDNAQMKIMKFMPWVFTLICYNFSCALALYSTVNGLFTIVQQLIVNRMKDDGDPAPTPAPAGGRKVKNVTPRKS